MRLYGASYLFGLKSDSLDTKCVSKIYKIVTKSMSYKRYREILFQKVVSGYELPFVQPGYSKNILKRLVLHKYIKHLKNPPTLRSRVIGVLDQPLSLHCFPSCVLLLGYPGEGPGGGFGTPIITYRYPSPPLVRPPGRSGRAPQNQN